MKKAAMSGVRSSANFIPCAIYTRKSSEEGLEQNFNSLDAQREACEAYVLSQKAEGWTALPQYYDDGGYSGGTMERPALKQLMSDIVAKKVRIVVVYKVDRLTRSLADFAKLVELFDAYGVSFVSITQQFNTTSSMGRLTLNVLLSFAQFEREVTGERIRDKIAASKARGLWMGGMPPVGYEAKDKALVIDVDSATLVREIYRCYLELGNVRSLKAELSRRGWTTPVRLSKRQGQSGGRPFSRGHLYRILSNPVYVGKVAHKENLYPGQHPAIVDDVLWEAVQARLISNRQGHKSRSSATHPGLLTGLVFDIEGERLTSVHSKKKTIGNSVSTGKETTSRRYRYYVSHRLLRENKDQAPRALRIPAQELEQAVMGRLLHLLKHGVELFGILDSHGLTDATAVHAVLHTAVRMTEGFPSEDLTADTRACIELLQTLIERVVVSAHELEITLKLGPLIERARTTSHTSPAVWAVCEWETLTHTMVLPVRIKRSGLAVRLIVQTPEHEIRRSADAKMVKLLSKAHDWFNQLASGKAESIQQISDREQVTRPYVSRVIQLAFLAPDLVHAILGGKHPPMLTVDKLMRSLPLPIDWQEQRKLLGFE